MHCCTRQPVDPHLPAGLEVGVHLESKRPRKDNTEEDIVLSEEEARFRFPLAIDFLACYWPLPGSERVGVHRVTCL